MNITLALDSKTVARHKRLKELDQELAALMIATGADNSQPQTITDEIRQLEIKIHTMRSRFNTYLLEAATQGIENAIKQPFDTNI
ncbi:hypothetical protein J8B38_22665 [Vibrio parahaemolyticus]|nr:hypothetical protein [Vibrio parahaemolyticus]